MSEAIDEIPLKLIGGEPSSLAAFRGEVLLIVNVASKCGLTPQYAGLEKLFLKYKERGFRVLGFPANDFLGQEPGTDGEIAEFCNTSYQVTFPLFSKIAVTGEAQHPLYSKLIEMYPVALGDLDTIRGHIKTAGMTPTPSPGVLWNFEKFLVARDGHVAGRFAPTTTPEDAVLVDAIEEELGRAV